MANLLFLLRGIILGLSIAAPVGPIGVLCIRRTLIDGRKAGFVLGLGAATADMCYGAVAAFGLTVISSLLLGERLWIHILGALFLFLLAIKTMLTLPATEAATVSIRLGLVGTYLSTLLLTLTNPTTVLSFVAIFAGIGIVGTHNNIAATSLMVAGVFCGSALWWLILSSVVTMVRSKFTLRTMRWVNYLSGTILLGFALYALLTLAH